MALGTVGTCSALGIARRLVVIHELEAGITRRSTPRRRGPRLGGEHQADAEGQQPHQPADVGEWDQAAGQLQAAGFDDTLSQPVTGTAGAPLPGR